MMGLFPWRLPWEQAPNNMWHNKASWEGTSSRQQSTHRHRLWNITTSLYFVNISWNQIWMKSEQKLIIGTEMVTDKICYLHQGGDDSTPSPANKSCLVIEIILPLPQRSVVTLASLFVTWLYLSGCVFTLRRSVSQSVGWSSLNVWILLTLTSRPLVHPVSIVWSMNLLPLSYPQRGSCVFILVHCFSFGH